MVIESKKIIILLFIVLNKVFSIDFSFINIQTPKYLTAITFKIDYNRSLFENFELNSKISQQIDLYSIEKKENPFRRAEILFFGSLTIISFGSWLGFSIYNIIIYGDNFGILRREQFLIIYLGSSILALSVSISDLLKRNNKFKNIEFF